MNARSNDAAENGSPAPASWLGMCRAQCVVDECGAARGAVDGHHQPLAAGEVQRS
jgi:hypothetical protein